MAGELSPLELLIQQIMAALQAPLELDAQPVAVTMRERFMELLVLSLASLYGRTPIPASPFDRATMRVITTGLDDNDSSKFSKWADDWMRLEGILRVQEGAKVYTLNRMSLAVLSTMTSQGVLGEVMEGVASVYANPGPSQQLRQATRNLGAYFMTRLGRGG
jgi:hypothetical protein